jgi:2-polyprenyl-3-methyl-5-hydroxy-6-metoxy-1,4-benzoquinol methylase
MSDQRINYLINRISPNKAVLDVGCAQNPAIYKTISKKSTLTVGIDIDEKTIIKMAKSGARVFKMNAENINLPYKFDYIIAGEIIEHLSNPGLFLRSAKKHLKRGGEIILTTPNVSSLLLYFLVVMLDKTQDPTHVYYFDHKNLAVLVKRFNLEIAHTKYIPPEVKFLGTGPFRMVFYIGTLIANLGYLFSKRLFGSYILIVLKNKI